MSLVQNQISYHIKLGVFLALGMVLLLSGVFFIGQMRKLFSQTFTISSVFKDVDGLQVGNNVQFGGMHVGTIESVNMLNDTSIQVFMVIEESKKKFIRTDASATIGSDGLMGNKILVISPGSARMPHIENNGTLLSIVPPRLDELIFKLSNTVDNVSLITGDLALITHKISRGKGTIGKLLMDTLFADNLDQTLIHIERGTKGFEDNMDAAKHSIFFKRYFDKKKEPQK